jgi:hypothetical protein
MTTSTMRYLRGDFVVTGPDLSRTNSSPAARPGTGARKHFPGSPVIEIGADASKPSGEVGICKCWDIFRIIKPNSGMRHLK